MRRFALMKHGTALCGALLIAATPAFAGEKDRARQAIAEANAKIEASLQTQSAGEGPSLSAEAQAALRTAREELGRGHERRAINEAHRASELADRALAESRKAAAADATAAQVAAQQAAEANARAAAAEAAAASAAARPAQVVVAQPAPAQTTVTTQTETTPTTTTTTRRTTTAPRRTAAKAPVRRSTAAAQRPARVKTTTTVSTSR